MAQTIDMAILTKAALALYDEAYLGSPNANGTWFIDNDPKNGTLGTLESLSAEAASRPATPGDPLTVASHAEHLRFSLSLANRAARGESPYADARWSESWKVRSVSEAEWRALLASLRREYEEFRWAISSGAMWKDEDILTGTLALVCHGAWHLGAIRQALGLVVAPK